MNRDEEYRQTNRDRRLEKLEQERTNGPHNWDPDEDPEDEDEDGT